MPSHLWDNPSALYIENDVLLSFQLRPDCNLGVTWLWIGSLERRASEAILGVSGDTAICCRHFCCKYRAKTIRDLLCSVYGNFLRQSDTNPSHTQTQTNTHSPQIPPTMPTRKTRAQSFLLSLHHLNTPTGPPTHKHTHIHSKLSAVCKLSRIEIVQVEKGLQCNQWKRRGRFN